MNDLSIENFAQISETKIQFGDLTVLVGAQGTGKSLVLQWLKVAMDGKQVIDALKQAGQDVKPETIIDQIFGVGMGSAWTSQTSIMLDGRQINTKNIGKRGNGREKVFFIPAHRSMLISDGWAAPFQKLTTDTPVVARLFSQNLFDRFTARNKGKLFPLPKVLKQDFRNLIDKAVFHGGTVGLEKDPQHAKRLKLSHGETQLPFMTWTAGQREFTPLLLGLYHLLPSTQIRRRQDIEYVVIEEPEMGLHPEAISVFMLLVFDLIWRGYRVVLSTHSPTILSIIWMLRRLKEEGAPNTDICDAFALKKNEATKQVAESALKAISKVYLLHFDPENKINSKDISALDPGDEDDDVSGWGGLTGFSSHFGSIVRRAVNRGGK